MGKLKRSQFAKTPDLLVELKKGKMGGWGLGKTSQVLKRGSEKRAAVGFGNRGRNC